MNKETAIRIFSRMPTIETKRLTLRKMRLSDSDDMYAYAKDPGVTKYLLWSPHPDEEYTYRYLEYVNGCYQKGEFYDWAVVLREERKMIGTCGFTRFDYDNNGAEIGYVLSPDYWGRKIAPEAIWAILRFGFITLNLHRIEAKFMEGNERSRRVMEKCGMTFEGAHRSSMLIRNEYKTIGVCAILSEEFINAW